MPYIHVYSDEEKELHPGLDLIEVSKLGVKVPTVSPKQEEKIHAAQEKAAAKNEQAAADQVAAEQEAAAGEVATPKAGKKPAAKKKAASTSAPTGARGEGSTLLSGPSSSRSSFSR